MEKGRYPTASFFESGFRVSTDALFKSGIFSVAVTLGEVTGWTHRNVMHQSHGFSADFDRHLLALQRLLHRIRETLLHFVQCEHRHGDKIRPVISPRQAAKSTA